MSDNDRMTEAEWELRRNREECAVIGHDWDIVVNGGGNPVSLFCSNNCGTGPFKINHGSAAEDFDRLAEQHAGALVEAERLRLKIDRLQHWKKEALTVIGGVQKIGKELDLPLGVPIHEEAPKAIRALKTKIKKAQELHSHYQAHGADGCDLCRQPWPCETVRALNG